MNAFDMPLLRRNRAEASSPAQLAARVRRFKINFLNRFIRQNDIVSVIQFGTDDAKLMHRLKIGAHMIVDPSPRRLELCGAPGQDMVAAGAADLTLSIDTIHLLNEDREYNAHIRNLFDTARTYVVIHGSEFGPAWAPVARRFTAHVARYFPAWRLAAHVPMPFPPAIAGGDFFAYARNGVGCVIPVMPL